MTIDVNLFSLSPMLWNMTIPRGIPKPAYTIQKALPDTVAGVL